MKSATETQSKVVTAAQIAQMLADGAPVQMVDVRSPAEFEESHIPYAINIPMEEMRSRVGDLRPDEPVVLICHSGGRAAMCQVQLDLHRPDVSVLKGGTQAWQADGRPVIGKANKNLSIMRQVQIVAGTLILLGVLLSLLVHPGWLGLSAFVGAGLLFAGISGFCGMAIILAKMPWNRVVTR
jgi:rhodanese-related sulfurtransferase